MRAKLIFLSLLLLVQLGLAFVLGVGSNNLKAFDATRKLLRFDGSSIDRLVFEGSAKQLLVLQKQGEHWTLPEHFAAHADGRKIDDLLHNLAELRRPWPVAEKGTADRRFKVADDNFERRLSLFHGDKKLTSLVIGSSPGFRKVHARVADETTVYDIPFSTFQVSLKPEDWVDKDQLQLKADRISAVELADCNLVKQVDQLVVTDLKPDEQTASRKVTELVDKLAGLRIVDALARPEQSLAAAPELSLSLTLADGGQRSYRFYKGADDKELQLQVAGQPWLFKVAAGLKDELAAYTRQRLVQPRQDENRLAGKSPAPPE